MMHGMGNFKISRVESTLVWPFKPSIFKDSEYFSRVWDTGYGIMLTAYIKSISKGRNLWSQMLLCILYQISLGF
jgi:hypothetical protein